MRCVLLGSSPAPRPPALPPRGQEGASLLQDGVEEGAAEQEGGLQAAGGGTRRGAQHCPQGQAQLLPQVPGGVTDHRQPTRPHGGCRGDHGGVMGETLWVGLPSFGKSMCCVTQYFIFALALHGIQIIQSCLVANLMGKYFFVLPFVMATIAKHSR